MNNYLEILSVPAIAAIVYWLIEIIKYAVGSSEKFKRFIPLISCLIGVILGIISYYFVPEIIPAKYICGYSNWCSKWFNCNRNESDC